MRINHILLAAALLGMASSCTTGGYETGDGSLSAMRADFVEAATDAQSAIVSIETDDGEKMYLTRKISLQWAARPDTAYRALMYYNKTSGEQGTTQASPLSVAQVLVPEVRQAADFIEGVKTDPLTFESAWKSRNGRYLNLDLSVKNGKADDDTARHLIGMACDGVDQNTDGTRTIRLRLYHDQGGVPEYYSAKLYISVPLSRLPVTPTTGDTVTITINTYGGELTKSFTI